MVLNSYQNYNRTNPLRIHKIIHRVGPRYVETSPVDAVFFVDRL